MDRPNAEGTSGSPAERDSAAAATANKRLRIVTRCGSLDEFFATFGPFADDQSLFIVTNKPRPLGLRQPFVIQLRDGEAIMRGDVEVIASITDGSGPDGRNGMRLALLSVDDATRAVHRRLLERARNKPASPVENPPDSVAIASEARPELAPSGAAAARPAPPPRAPAALSASHDAPPPSRSSADLAGSEERAPGAAYQLPANPFESVTAEALESFVECTLYEERLPRTAELDGAPDDAPPPSRSRAALSEMLAAPGPALAPPAFGPPPAPAPTFGSALTFVPAPGKSPARDSAAGTRRKPLIVGLAVTAIVSSIASLVAAYFVWGRTAAPLPPASSGPAAISPPITTASADRTGSPPPEPSATATVAPSATTTSEPLQRDCKANVRSYPTGATILWNGETLGTTPLAEVAVACGPAKVTFDLLGYEHGERSAGAVVGRKAGVFLRLVPILVGVDVTSTPPGALVLVDGRTVGRTPANISMVGMREATMVIKLPRFKNWTRKLTPEPPKTTVHADLERQ